MPFVLQAMRPRNYRQGNRRFALPWFLTESSDKRVLTLTPESTLPLWERLFEFFHRPSPLFKGASSGKELLCQGEVLSQQRFLGHAEW
jgi:hypothetical protein